MKTSTSHVKVTVKSANKCVQKKLSYCEKLLTVLVVLGENYIKFTVQIMVSLGFLFFGFFIGLGS